MSLATSCYGKKGAETKSFLLRSVVSARGTSEQIIKNGAAEDGECGFFFSGIKMHCDLSWYLNKHALLYVALSMVEKTSRPVIFEDKTSE